MTLRFLEFFDWSQLDVRDNELIRVEILASTRYPDVVGREALIDAKGVFALAFPGTPDFDSALSDIEREVQLRKQA